jgi:hypothetical protein
VAHPPIPETLEVMFIPSTGADGLGQPFLLAVPDPVRQLAVGDFDSDGVDDVLATLDDRSGLTLLLSDP